MATGNYDSILNKEEITGDAVQQRLEEKDNAILLDQPVEVDGEINSCCVHTKEENGFHHNIPGHDESVEWQMVIELSSQNESLKSQLGDLKSELLGKKPTPDQEGQSEQHIGSSEQDNNLHEQLIRLQKEIHEQKETQKAAEDALEHLRIAYSVADGKVQELYAKLIEAQLKMEQEIKERENKYVELDTKFGRLHKRAKQRIQELQKEKDELEARFNEVTVKLEQTLSQQMQAQQELERSDQQASEALKSMDVERQHLRSC